jgi:hypothetical protein
MPRKDDPNFWSDVKSYLKKNESTFGKNRVIIEIGNMLLELKNTDFTIGLLVELEELIKEHPHVI